MRVAFRGPKIGFNFAKILTRGGRGPPGNRPRDQSPPWGTPSGAAQAAGLARAGGRGAAALGNPAHRAVATLPRAAGGVGGGTPWWGRAGGATGGNPQRQGRGAHDGHKGPNGGACGRAGKPTGLGWNGGTWPTWPQSGRNGAADGVRARSPGKKRRNPPGAGWRRGTPGGAAAGLSPGTVCAAGGAALGGGGDL